MQTGAKKGTGGGGAGQPEMPPPLVERYEVLGLFTERPTARLYSGRTRGTRESILIKLSSRSTDAYRAEWNDFVHRVELCNSLGHPNLVRIHEIGLHQNHVYTVMEHVSGPTLRDFVFGEADNLTVGGLLELLRGVAAGIDTLHASRLVHRDIKPDNIFVSSADRVPKVGDFGIALTVREIEQAPDCDPFGTPAFMAPEQIISRNFGPSVDIYAFAVTIYSLLTRRTLFDCQRPSDLLYAHVHLDPVPVHLRNRNWPAAVHRVLAQSLSKDPTQRHPTAGALVTEVARTLDSYTPFRLAQYYDGRFSSGEVPINF